MKIFIDMDGVLADFVGGVDRLFGYEGEHSGYRLEEDLGLSEDPKEAESMFWAKIDKQGSDFWTNLDAFPWTVTLLEVCSSLSDDVFICTTPSLDPNCAKGKLQWIIEKLPPTYRRKFVITPAKELLADLGRILIDDKDSNVQRWIDAGGTGILFPTFQNTLHEAAEDPYSHVMSILSGIEGLNHTETFGNNAENGDPE